MSVRRTVALLGVAALAAALALSAPASSSSHHPPPASKPTIVLVHGAFADASGWSGVVERLQKRGYTVVAPPNPLRGVSEDSAYIKAVLDDTPGPIVLVGHSYGGMVITNAASGDPDVKALVYIAAFAPDKGHTVLSLSRLAPGGELGPALAFRDVPVPGGQEGYITPSAFREVFAADVDRSTAAVMAASQRPAAVAALGEPSPNEPAWRTIPSWYMVATQDRAIGAAPERIMAKRIGAKTVEVRSSHVPMITHPREVTELILAATRSGH